MLVLKTILMIGIVELAVILLHSVILSAIDVQVQLALVALLAVVIPIVVAELRASRAQRIASAEKAAELVAAKDKALLEAAAKKLEIEAAAKEFAAQREDARQTREEAKAAREAADKVSVKVEEVAVKAEGVATALAEKSASDSESASAKATLVAEQAAKIEKIAKTTQDTLTHLNGEKSASLKRFLVIAERMKIKTGEPEDIKIYDEAKLAYDAHQRDQVKVDETAGDKAKI